MGGPLIDLFNGLRTGDMGSVIVSIVVIAVILLFAFPVHELAHAVVADKLGDDTPRLNGRITLNPFKHLSLFGSLMFLLVGFGYATTPINPLNFRGDWRMKHALVAVAGPLANLALAILFALAYRIGIGVVGDEPGFAGRVIMTALSIAVSINVLLFIFNLIPIPPFDGGTILKAFAPESLRGLLDQVGQYGWILFIVLANFGFFRFINGPVISLTRLLLG